MTSTTHGSGSGRVGATAMLLAPATLLVSFLVHPFLTVLPSGRRGDRWRCRRRPGRAGALVPILVTSVITYAIGLYGFARGIADSAVLDRGATRTVVTALALMAVARAVPIGVVQFHVQGLAGLVALWPLGAVTWRRSRHIASVHRRPSEAI